MSAIVIGALIVAFTALKAGPALLALTGRESSPVLDIAWPLGLWLLTLMALFALVPRTPLLSPEQGTPTLVTASVLISVLYAMPLARTGWRLWRERNPDA